MHNFILSNNVIQFFNDLKLHDLVSAQLTVFSSRSYFFYVQTEYLSCILYFVSTI